MRCKFILNVDLANIAAAYLGKQGLQDMIEHRQSIQKLRIRHHYGMALTTKWPICTNKAVAQKLFTLSVVPFGIGPSTPCDVSK